MATRNDAKVRETTCGYAKGVDDINRAAVQLKSVLTGATDVQSAFLGVCYFELCWLW